MTRITFTIHPPSAPFIPSTSNACNLTTTSQHIFPMFSTALYRRFRGKRYLRLSAAAARGNSIKPAARIHRKRRRFWPLNRWRKNKKKIKFGLFSPGKFLVGFRDAYVNLMMRISNSRLIGAGYYGGDRDYMAGFGGGRPWNDERMVVEICKSMVVAGAQRGIVPSGGGLVCSGVRFRR